MANWKDYENNSQLVLVFGHISASVLMLDETHYGVVLHPYVAFTIEGTLLQAKIMAEQVLRAMLTLAVNNLPLRSIEEDAATMPVPKTVLDMFR